MKKKLVLNEQYKKIGNFIENLPSTFRDTGEVLYAERNIIKSFDVDGIKLNVKSFKKPIWINQFIYSTLRLSKARRSYQYAFMLQERGFQTPTPVAYMELKKFNLLKYSLYISIHEQFDGLMRELRTGPIEGREELLRQFAQFTARLHEEKILHLDYSSGNILYKKKDNNYTFYLVDLNRMKFDKTIDLKTACFNFRRLWGSNEMISFIVKEYAKARNFDEVTCLAKTFEYRKKFWDSFNKQYPEVTPYFG